MGRLLSDVQYACVPASGPEDVYVAGSSICECASGPCTTSMYPMTTSYENIDNRIQSSDDSGSSAIAIAGGTAAALVVILLGVGVLMRQGHSPATDKIVVHEDTHTAEVTATTRLA
eukprot:m.321532 g.321532  ORF g.321532 m.321532 type:complete len:116 (+) comp20336_c0_seq12:2368-2715(+)